MELATRAYPLCGSPIVFARLIESALSARFSFIGLPAYHFFDIDIANATSRQDVRVISLIARQALFPECFT